MEDLKETNRVEFKKELSAKVDLEKEVIAFLNTTEGGFVYIGVNDEGKPVGVDEPESKSRRFARYIPYWA